MDARWLWQKLRSFLASHTNPLWLIDFAGQKIFESATVDVNILIFEKSTNLEVDVVIAKDKCLDNLSVLLSKHWNNERIVMSWSSSGAMSRCSEKIETNGVALKDWDINIYRGILNSLIMLLLSMG